MMIRVIDQRRAELVTTTTTAAGAGAYAVPDADADSGLDLAATAVHRLLAPFLEPVDVPRTALAG